MDRFVLPPIQGQRRRIVAVYLDPANFKNIGDGHTIADQINEILAPCDLGAWKASNDRIGGWQLMYQLLQKGEWQIADTCPKLIEVIPSRMHDEKKPGDVLKVPGDPLDDVADDARYGIYTFITSTEKPREVVLRETLAPILETVQDTNLSEAERRAAATSVLLRRQQIMAESQHASQSATLGRYRIRGR